MSASQESPSPWASDAIPVAEPAPITWDHLERPGPSGPDVGRAATGSSTPGPPFPPPLIVGDSIVTAPPETARSTRRSSLVSVIGVAAAMMLVGGSIWLVTNDNDTADANDRRTELVARPSVEPPPPVVTSATTSSTTTTTSRQSPTPAIDPVTNDSTILDEPTAIDSIDLPSAVAAIQTPTEVVILNEDGVQYTLSLPGGAVRSVDLTQFGLGYVGAGTFGVTPTASLVVSNGRNIVLVDRQGAVTEVGPLPDPAATEIYSLGWVRRDDGSTASVVVTFGGTPSAQAWYAVSDDGIVLPITSYSWSGYATPLVPDGARIVNDAGGAYRLDLDGQPARISTGNVLAATPSHLVIRECDERLACAVVVESVVDGTRRTLPPDTAARLSETYGVSLSPDGTTASYTPTRDFDTREVADLVTGEVATFDYAFTGGFPQRSWAADSSGEFLATNSSGTSGLTFFDRATGTAISFGGEFGFVTAVGVRHPDALLAG